MWNIGHYGRTPPLSPADILLFDSRAFVWTHFLLFDWFPTALHCTAIHACISYIAIPSIHHRLHPPSTVYQSIFKTANTDRSLMDERGMYYISCTPSNHPTLFWQTMINLWNCLHQELRPYTITYFLKWKFHTHTFTFTTIFRKKNITCFEITGAKLYIRDGWRYQNGWIFGKVPKGGGGSFSIQKFVLQNMAL